MHKNGKWAQQLIALQEEDGKWGCFHSLSQVYGASVTTEQALRRLERLGYTMEDACIQKAVAYMDDCLTGKKAIPDPREKLHDWDIFTALMLSTWIRRFAPDNPNANEVAEKWAAVISRAFAGGTYDHEAYCLAYRRIWGLKPNGGRIIDFVNFYPLSLLRGCLDEKTERIMLDYVLSKEDGIYYIYDKKLADVPACFASRETSRYLAALELLSRYEHGKDKLAFAASWLEDCRNENGKWDMGKNANDTVYFPLSDDWRKKETREADCTERIEKLLRALDSGGL